VHATRRSRVGGAVFELAEYSGARRERVEQRRPRLLLRSGRLAVHLRGDFDPDLTALELIEELYFEFGYSREHIPRIKMCQYPKVGAWTAHSQLSSERILVPLRSVFRFFRPKESAQPV